jgi:hypothetical protein
MTPQPTPEALAAHTFEYDAATLDKPLADFLQKFYTFSDEKEHPEYWASCFAENATMKKLTTDVTGRDGKFYSRHYFGFCCARLIITSHLAGQHRIMERPSIQTPHCAQGVSVQRWENYGTDGVRHNEAGIR